MKINKKYFLILVIIILMVIPAFRVLPSFLSGTPILEEEQPSFFGCLLQGGRVTKQGIRGAYCRKTFSDTNKTCFQNRECLSKKCILKKDLLSKEDMDQYSHYSFELGYRVVSQLPDTIYGTCSSSNQDTCYTSEITINDGRNLDVPPICD